MSINYDYLFKLLLVGDSGVGKSSLLSRFVDEIYTEEFISTVGVDFKIKTVDIHNQTCKIQVWDTAGQERFKSITSVYYKGANGCIVVYDITNRESFDHVHNWLTELETYAPPGIPILLVGNKSDMVKQRMVLEEEGILLAKDYNMEFVETSAKNNNNIENAFLSLAEKIKMIQKPIRDKQIEQSSIKITPVANTSSKRKCCI
jgi:Ras-related protein Rab-1A